MKAKFICPACKEKSLAIIKSLDLGPDKRSDEVAIQCVECQNCEFKGIAIYEESRRGASESINHYGYKINAIKYQGLRNDIDNGQVSHYKDYNEAGDAIFTMILVR